MIADSPYIYRHQQAVASLRAGIVSDDLHRLQFGGIRSSLMSLSSLSSKMSTPSEANIRLCRGLYDRIEIEIKIEIPDSHPCIGKPESKSLCSLVLGEKVLGFRLDLKSQLHPCRRRPNFLCR